MPDGSDADAFRKIVLERFDMSLGTGLGKLAGKVFRIGHLGCFNDLMLCGTLCGVEMGLDARRRAASQGRRAGGARLSRRDARRDARPRGLTTRCDARPRAVRARGARYATVTTTDIQPEEITMTIIDPTLRAAAATCCAAWPAIALAAAGYVPLASAQESRSSSATSASRARCSRSAPTNSPSAPTPSSRGKAKVVTYGSSQLGGDKEMMQKLKLGTLDMALPSTVMSSRGRPVRHVRDALPRQGPRAHGAIEKEIFWPKLEPAAEKKGLKVLAVWENGYRHITNNKQPIKMPADLQGIKLRVPEGKWRVKMFQAYGANPEPDEVLRAVHRAADRRDGRPGESAHADLLAPSSRKCRNTCRCPATSTRRPT